MIKKIFYKRTILVLAMAVIAVAAGTWSGCNSEVYDVYDTYLSVNTSIDAHAPENLVILREAQLRMDPYVKFNNGKFELKKVNAARLSMSEDLFDQLKSAMKHTNEVLKVYRAVEIKPNVLRIIDPGDQTPLSTLRTRLKGEDYPPNSNGIDLHWYGADIYLSHRTLELIRGASTTVAGIAVIAGIFGAEPAWLVGGYAGFIAGLADIGATLCPNGVIVNYFIWLNTPFWASCQ